jgi:hypothetical protein
MVVFNDKILKQLEEKYPEFTYASLRKLTNYGVRKMIHFLNNEHEVLITGSKKKGNYDGLLICEEVSYRKHIDKLKIQKLKEQNRNRVNRYKEKHNG